MPRVIMEYHHRPKPPGRRSMGSIVKGTYRPQSPFDNRFHHHIEVVYNMKEWDGWQAFAEACLYPGSVMCYHRFGLGNYDFRESTFMFRTKADALMFKLAYAPTQA